MSSDQNKISSVLEALRKGTHQVRSNPSESNYQKWEDRIERAGQGSLLGLAFGISAIIALIVVGLIILNAKCQLFSPQSKYNSGVPSPASEQPQSTGSLFPQAPFGGDNSHTSEGSEIEAEENPSSILDLGDEESELSEGQGPNEAVESVSGSIIRVNTRQILPDGTRIRVLIYDNNGDSKEAGILRATQKDYGLEIQLKDSIPGGTKYSVDWYPPQ